MKMKTTPAARGAAAKKKSEPLRTGNSVLIEAVLSGTWIFPEAGPLEAPPAKGRKA